MNIEEKLNEINNANLDNKENLIEEFKNDDLIQLLAKIMKDMIKEKDLVSIKENYREETKKLQYRIDIEKFSSTIKLKNENIKQLNKKIDNLNIDIDTINKTVKKLNSNIEQLEDENNKLQVLNTKSKKEIKESKNIIIYYDKKYSSIEYIHSKYNTMSESIKDGLNGIFKFTEDVDMFLMSCADYNKLIMFWEFIKDAVINDRYTDDIENINEVFDYIFDRYNKLSNNRYERVETNIGDDFDTEYHIRKGNIPSGEVKEILLKGIRDTQTNKIIQKTIVKL